MCNDRLNLGIFNFATGAGKTLTAIYGATQIIKWRGRGFLMVAVPFVNLADQWQEELMKFEYLPIMCYGNRTTWQSALSSSVRKFNNGIVDCVSIVVVNKSLADSDFLNNQLYKLKGEDLIVIGDECHRHGTERLNAMLPKNFPYRIGLSATYKRYKDREGTEAILKYYGQPCGQFTIEDGLKRKVLSNYYYFPIFVDLTEEEEDAFRQISAKIEKLRKNVNLHSVYDFGESTGNKSLDELMTEKDSLLGSAKNKIKTLEEQILKDKIEPYTLVYCSPGRTTRGDENSPFFIDLV